MRCLGSAQHLRSKYGDGLQIEIGMQVPTPEAISSQATQLLSFLNKALDAAGDNPMTRQEVEEMFGKLGKAFWVDRINVDGTGSDLHSTLASQRFVGIKHVAQWVLLEVIYDKVSLFLASTFGAYVQRERQPSKLRVEITARMPDGTPRALSKTFGALEANKESLQIQEYSIAQTSLEQIFNGFAAQQEEEAAPSALRVLNAPSDQNGGCCGCSCCDTCA